MSCFVLSDKSINQIARGIYKMSMTNNVLINNRIIYCEEECKEIIKKVNDYTEKKYWEDNFEREIASVLKYINEKAYFVRYGGIEPKYEKINYENDYKIEELLESDNTKSYIALIKKLRCIHYQMLEIDIDDKDFKIVVLIKKLIQAMESSYINNLIEYRQAEWG